VGSVTVTVTNLLMILMVQWHQLDHMQIICMSGARFKWLLLTQETATALPSVLWHCWLGITMCIWHAEWWGAGVVICLERSGVVKGGAGRPWWHLPRGGTSTTIEKFFELQLFQKKTFGNHWPQVSTGHMSFMSLSKYWGNTHMYNFNWSFSRWN